MTEQGQRYLKIFSVDLLLVVVFVLLGLLLRVAYMVEIRHSPEFEHPLLDSAYFDYWARGIAFGQWTCEPGAHNPEIATTPFCRPPGYPYFLAAVYVLTNGSYLAVRVVQCGIGLVSAVLAYFLGRRIFGRFAGLVACLVMSTYWAFVFYDCEIHSPVLNVFLLMTFMLAAAKWFDSQLGRHALLLGVVGGLLALFRPETLAFFPLLIVWMFWARLRAWGRRVVLTHALLCIAGCMVIVGIVVARNYRVAGELVFCTSGGLNLYGSNNELANGVDPGCDLSQAIGLNVRLLSNTDYPIYVRALRRKLNDDSISFSATSRYFSKLAVDYILHHPGHIARLLARKTALFWGPIEVANDKENQISKEMSPVLNHLPGFRYVAAFFFCGVLTFFFFGAAKDRDGGRVLAWLVLLYVFVYFSTVVWFITPARYRLPVIPLMIVFGAFGVSTFVRHVQQRHLRQASILFAAFVVALVFFSINFTRYEPRAYLWHTQRGLLFQAERDFKKAEEEFRSAGPNVLDMLGGVLLQDHRYSEALECFLKVLDTRPVKMASDYDGAGLALLNLGRFDEAIEMCRKALNADPTSTQARTHLGLALIARKDYAGAAVEFEHLLNSDARREAMHNLAWIEELNGRREAAKAKYQAVLAEFPTYAESHNNLGYLLLSEGKREEARAHFAAAIKASPNYILAHENMAILLRDAGEKEAAAIEFRKILQINPANRFAHKELAALGSN